MGGVSQTHLALKYAYTAGSRYKSMAQVRAGSDTKLITSYVMIGCRLGILYGPPKEIHDNIR